MSLPIEVTQPGIGGTDVNSAEGPLRSGLTPKRVTYPLDPPPFYKDQIRSISRVETKGVQNHPPVRVRFKTVVLAAGGVFNSFSRGH